jgi:proteasome lid subunit RPN8/RPN11
VAFGFRSSKQGIVAHFSAGEARILEGLLTQLLTLLMSEQSETGDVSDPLVALTGISDAPVEPPVDPALARLLPDGYADDPERAAEFRRFTEAELRAGKQSAARAAIESLPLPEGGRIVVTPELADAWLGALNDLRLALGVRLDVTEDPYDELERIDPSSRRKVELTAFAWLGELLETLVAALMDTPAERADVLTIDRATYDAIVAHARRDHPDEACGVVAGVGDKPTRVIEMTNTARSPTFYEMDSMEVLRTLRSIDDADEELLAIYHSHTATEAYPSRTDISIAGFPEAHYILVSTRPELPPGGEEFRSYRIVDGEVSEEEVRIEAESDADPAG